MKLYAGTGPTMTDALLALAHACRVARREIDLDSLTSDVARDVFDGRSVLVRVEAETHPLEAD